MATPTPLILAAGASSRMGRAKASLPFGETTALGLILEACADAGLGDPVVVAGAHEGAVRAAAGGAKVLVNTDWSSGRMASIQVGLQALAEEAPFLLWPVDVCLPGAGVVEALLSARACGPEALGWVPSHDGRRGHPVLLDGSLAARFSALGPDASAREVIRALHAEGTLVHVETDDPSVLMNMNTPEDYERWSAEYAKR